MSQAGHIWPLSVTVLSSAKAPVEEADEAPRDFQPCKALWHFEKIRL